MKRSTIGVMALAVAVVIIVGLVALVATTNSGTIMTVTSTVTTTLTQSANAHPQTVTTLTVTKTEVSTQTLYSNASSIVTAEGSSCFRTGQGYAFYVRVVADGSGTPIEDALVEAASYTECPNQAGNTTTTFVGHETAQSTPANGTISLPPAGVDGYMVTVEYQGTQYPSFKVFIAPIQITTATLSIPSGRVNVTVSAPSG